MSALEEKVFGFPGTPQQLMHLQHKGVSVPSLRKAVQSPERPFSCLPLISFLSPFFVQSFVQTTLPRNKEHRKVISTRSFGI